MSLTMITAVNDIPVHHDHHTEVTPNARAALIDAGWTPPESQAGQVSTLEEAKAAALRAAAKAIRDHSPHYFPRGESGYDEGWHSGYADGHAAAVGLVEALARDIHHP